MKCPRKLFLRLKPGNEKVTNISHFNFKIFTTHFTPGVCITFLSFDEWG
jgi:hypothetical protein